MYSDPFSLVRDFTSFAVNAAKTLSLPASERAADHSTYRAIDADMNDHVLFIGHNYGRRNRYTARYTVSGFTPSLLVPDQNQTFSQSVYCVADVPISGPIESTTTATLLFRQQLVALSYLLLSSTGNEPPFRRAINGET